MINYRFLKLHDTLFFFDGKVGRNMGDKLDVTKIPGLRLQYDHKKDWFIVWVGDNFMTVMKESVLAGTPFNAKDLGYTNPILEIEMQKPQVTPDANTKMEAQVSTPHDAVFRASAGETGVGKRVGR